MAFYARLKKDVNGKKVEVGVLLGNKVLYPEDPRWMKRDDQYLAEAEADERIEILKDQVEVKEYYSKEDEEIENFVRGHWKATQKKIEEMTDQYFLKRALEIARRLNKDTIVQCIEERLEVLNKPHYE
jgi:hypothetical protein